MAQNRPGLSKTRGNSPPSTLADLRNAKKLKKSENITEEEVKQKEALGNRLENFAKEFDNVFKDRDRSRDVSPRLERFANLPAGIKAKKQSTAGTEIKLINLELDADIETPSLK